MWANNLVGLVLVLVLFMMSCTVVIYSLCQYLRGVKRTGPPVDISMQSSTMYGKELLKDGIARGENMSRLPAFIATFFRILRSGSTNRIDASGR